jgi:hypothetical protein
LVSKNVFGVKIPKISNSNHRNITFIKKNLGNINTDFISNLRDYFDKYNCIFMKLDIEGGEVDLFNSLSEHDLIKIKQIVIELHSAYEKVIPTRLSKTHWLAHIHPNNGAGMGANGVPNVFECTYVLKMPDDIVTLNSSPIPDPYIDSPNGEYIPDIMLFGYPFTTNIYRKFNI